MREEHSCEVEMPIAGLTSVLERRSRMKATLKPSSEAVTSDDASLMSRAVPRMIIQSASQWEMEGNFFEVF